MPIKFENSMPSTTFFKKISIQDLFNTKRVLKVSNDSKKLSLRRVKCRPLIAKQRVKRFRLRKAGTHTFYFRFKNKNISFFNLLPKKQRVRKIRLESQRNFIRHLPPLSFYYKHSFWSSLRTKDPSIKEWLLYNKPGIYAVECLENKFRYFGETQNLKDRFRSTYSTLRRRRHPSRMLQKDWNVYGSSKFTFTVLYTDNCLTSKKLRKRIESLLVQQNKFKTYNILEKYSRNQMSNLKGPGETTLPPQFSFEDIQFLNSLKCTNKVIPWFKEFNQMKKGIMELSQFDSLPGIYMICCLQTGKVYFGETKNLANRYKDTRRSLYNGRYSCKPMLKDVNTFGIDAFLFVPLYYGSNWTHLKTRQDVEKKLIRLNNTIVYNKQHSLKIKFKKSHTSQGVNGFPIPIYVEGKIYNSIGEIKKKFNLSWKRVNDRLNDNEKYPEWKYVDSKLNSNLSQLPKILYLVGNKVFKSKRSLIGLKDFGNLSKGAVDNRFTSPNFPDWQSILVEEFLEKSKNQDFELMW